MGEARLRVFDESGRMDLSDVSGGGRGARCFSHGRGGDGGGEKRNLWIGEDIALCLLRYSNAGLLVYLLSKL